MLRFLLACCSWRLCLPVFIPLSTCTLPLAAPRERTPWRMSYPGYVLICSCSLRFFVFFFRNDRFFESGTFLLPPGASFFPPLPPLSRFLGAFHPVFPLASTHASFGCFSPPRPGRRTSRNKDFRLPPIGCLLDDAFGSSSFSCSNQRSSRVGMALFLLLIGALRSEPPDALANLELFRPLEGEPPSRFSAGLTQDIQGWEEKA